MMSSDSLEVDTVYLEITVTKATGVFYENGNAFNLTLNVPENSPHHPSTFLLRFPGKNLCC